MSATKSAHSEQTSAPSAYEDVALQDSPDKLPFRPQKPDRWDFFFSNNGKLVLIGAVLFFGLIGFSALVAFIAATVAFRQMQHVPIDCAVIALPKPTVTVTQISTRVLFGVVVTETPKTTKFSSSTDVIVVKPTPAVTIVQAPMGDVDGH